MRGKEEFVASPYLTEKHTYWMKIESYRLEMTDLAIRDVVLRLGTFYYILSRCWKLEIVSTVRAIMMIFNYL